MVYFPETDTNDDAEHRLSSDPEPEDLLDRLAETAERISALIEPFADLITVVVQVLTVFVLIEKV